MKLSMLFLALLGFAVAAFAQDSAPQTKPLKEKLNNEVQSFKKNFEPVPTGDKELDRILGSFSDFATGWVETILDYLPNKEIPIEPPKTLPRNSFSNKKSEKNAKTK